MSAPSTLPAEAPRGWFRGAQSPSEQTVLVFRRPRESLGPRLAAVRPSRRARRAGTLPPSPGAARRAAERAAVEPDAVALPPRASRRCASSRGDDERDAARRGSGRPTKSDARPDQRFA